jgi:hypothetical protein
VADVEHHDLIVARLVEYELGKAAERQNANAGSLVEATTGTGIFRDQLDCLADAALDGERPLGLRTVR